jgi:hypothetical protein
VRPLSIGAVISISADFAVPCMASPWETLAELPKRHRPGGFYFFGLRWLLCNHVYLSIVKDLEVCFGTLFTLV